MDLATDRDIQEHLGAERYRDAFELLLARYQHKVFRLSWSMLGDQAAAEEMAQDVFLQIWRVLPDYRGEASLSTWIYAITRNRCLTQRKKARGQGASSLEEPGVLRAVEGRVSRQERPSNEPDVVALMAQLPPPYRQALTLFYLEEKSYEEVAALMGIPVGTVKTHLHRARKQLAGSFSKEASAR